ncbi:toxin-antitoxin system, toxin component [Streptomyces sp. JJ36]|uniref:toxin-antitoxin system, toxin component n=1 Tax=Streptomyces sp. JJ36 TaxID=2736645 RepID=UPI001F1D11BD|nr:toxin-antitoxin system, toxin component [Streptomyces sp. JJ36]MCF6522408.1 toxin-antitoxin system, toxin component [Streptomyces sp. JJ36]
MRRLCGELVSGLEGQSWSAPRDLFGALCAAMGRRRERPVHLRTTAFPPGTASGLFLALPDRDLVVVEEHTPPDHQVVILGHELWHMHAGHGGHAAGGAAAAARPLAGGADLTTVVRRAAARTHFAENEEWEAERFGLLLGSACRPLLDGGPPRGEGPVGRIAASLCYRSLLG